MLRSNDGLWGQDNLNNSNEVLSEKLVISETPKNCLCHFKLSVYVPIILFALHFPCESDISWALILKSFFNVIKDI